MYIALALIVCLIGLVIWFVSVNPKVMEAGKIMFWTGLLAFLLRFSEIPTFHITR